MKDILRWFGRAFVARIGWVLAGLLLLFITGKSHAAVTCEPGAKVAYKVSSSTTPTVSGYTGGALPFADGAVTTYSAWTAAWTSFANGNCGTSGAIATVWNRQNIGATSAAGANLWGNDGATGTRTQWTSTAYCTTNTFTTPSNSQAIQYIVEGCGPSSCPKAGTVVDGVAFIGNVNDSLTTLPYNGLYCKVEGVGVCVGFPSGASPGEACSGGWVYTGVAGSAPSTPHATRPPSGPKVCSADGKKCVALGSANCAEVNGEFVCLGSAPTVGSCLLTPTDQSVCSADASHPLVTPPAPGVSGVVTPPQAVVAMSPGTGAGGWVGGTTVSVWGPGGAGEAGGTGTTTGTSTGEGSGSGSGGTGEGSSPVQCGGSGMPACKVESGETSPGPLSLPVLETARTFSESNAALAAAVAASPLVSAVSSVSIPSSGTCPTYSLSVPFLSTSLTFDSHCAIFESVRGVLAVIFLAIFSVVALRIALSA